MMKYNIFRSIILIAFLNAGYINSMEREQEKNKNELFFSEEFETFIREHEILSNYFTPEIINNFLIANVELSKAYFQRTSKEKNKENGSFFTNHEQLNEDLALDNFFRQFMGLKDSEQVLNDEDEYEKSIVEKMVLFLGQLEAHLNENVENIKINIDKKKSSIDVHSGYYYYLEMITAVTENNRDPLLKTISIKTISDDNDLIYANMIDDMIKEIDIQEKINMLDDDYKKTFKTEVSSMSSFEKLKKLFLVSDTKYGSRDDCFSEVCIKRDFRSLQRIGLKKMFALYIMKIIYGLFMKNKKKKKN